MVGAVGNVVVIKSLIFIVLSLLLGAASLSFGFLVVVTADELDSSQKWSAFGLLGNGFLFMGYGVLRALKLFRDK